MNLSKNEYGVLKLVIFLLAFIGIVFSAVLNPLYLTFFTGSFLVALFNKKKLVGKLFLFCIYSFFGSVIILFIEFVAKKHMFELPDNNFDEFIHSLVILLISIFPLKLIEFNIEKTKAISLRRNNLDNIYDKFPDLLCDIHYARTVEKTVLGDRIIQCRKSKKCLSLGRIINIKTLVGVIGDYKQSRKIGDEYSTMVWDNERLSVINGDFDSIEIREGVEIQDYNAAVSKVVAFFYNQVKLPKPISEISVKIAGNPPLSESTKRLLKERFQTIEYIVV